MIFSVALILLVGFALGGIAQKLKLPALIGMMVTGILLGPFVFGFIGDGILNISSELRSIALVIILLRAGIALDINDLKKIGLPAVLLCFVPPLIEIAAVIIIAPPILGITQLESAILGAVLCAVSPAVVVPRMLRLIENRLGTMQSIPQTILAATSVNGILAVVLFGIFMGMYESGEFSAATLLDIPLSVVSGILLGILAAFAAMYVLAKLQMRDIIKTFTILGVSLLLMAAETLAKPHFPLSGLLAVIAFGIMYQKMNNETSNSVSAQLSKIWIPAELMLFVLLGASVNIKYAMISFFPALSLIALALAARLIMVFVCLAGSKMNAKERTFCAFAYLPKATVQAAIGGIPLAMGVSAGETILTVAAVAILVLAPLGAFVIDGSEEKLLRKDNGENI